MKIVGGISNINHMEQRNSINKPQKGGVGAVKTEEKDLFALKKERPLSAIAELSTNIQNINSSLGKLSVLEESINSLKEEAQTLGKLAKQYNGTVYGQSERDSQKDRFDNTVNSMMDIIDNTLYGEKSLFANDIKVEAGGADNIILDVSRIEISDLSIDNQATIETFLLQMDSLGFNISSAKNVYNVRMFNSMAAMSTMVGRNEGLQEERFQSMNIATIAGNHNAELLREQMTLLLE